ncbi:hypothetical protein FDENT_4563 [Fusarium denticulatum]|uniref:DUF4874 domain-containing protein n=1 Tax=Fusarium denticulatum TaxID=48507 RepID=A0A8H5UHR2_9HYPO|nr:hypothetical protein FDENT_4563 [Fusarium denticulatum]
MHLPLILAMTIAVKCAATIGFTTYKEIKEGSDNSAAIQFAALDRSDTLFLYIQIIAGGDHAALINDFKALSQNYGSNGISIIPRVRYGTSSGDISAEPNDREKLLNDVATWANVFSDISGTVQIPVIQAGFLGQWGEWHSGPFCQAQGTDESAANLDVKRAVVTTLQGSRIKVALRYPRDHQALFNGNRAVTLHNDCIFNGGPGGYDGGTFPSNDRQTWVDYTKSVASGNTYGGEGCNQAGDSTYDWSNFGDVCGSNGLATYINAFQIAYLNPGNPAPLQQLFNDPNYSGCVDNIKAALEQHT